MGRPRQFLPLCTITAGIVFGGAASGASLLEWNTSSNLGTETTESSTFDAVGITSSTLILGSGVTGAANGNRFGGSNWFDTGDTNPTTLAESISGNDYIQFIVTPDSGYTFTATGFDFIWDRSGTGPSGLALRSSVDEFASDLASVTGDASGTSAFTNLTFSLTNIATATTFRLYGFGATGTTGTGGFDTATGATPNVLLIGSTSVISIASPTYWDTNGTTGGVGGDGTWNSASALFSTTSAGTDPAARTATDPVIFAGTAGTVTVDGTVEADGGISFETTGYQITGGTALELGGATNAITSATGVTSTINTAITGTGGVNKAGDGTLILGSANSFAGNVALNAGTLSISGDGNLGDSTNDLVFGGGTLTTTSTLALGGDRAISGSTGTMQVGSGNTLTIDGTVALSGALTLSDTGTVSFANAAAKTLGSLVFTTSGTLETTNGGLTVAGNLTANGTAGTATINAPLTLTATNTTVTVASGGTLELSQDVAATGRLITAGPGTLILGGAMTGASSGVRIGLSSATPTNGGTVQVGSAAALGTGQLQLNYGTLNATGALSITQGISMGGREGAAATFSGSDIDVTGTIGLFAAGGATGAHRINVNNNTTFSSAFDNTAATAGLTIGGAGKLTLAAANASLTDPITLVDAVTLSTTSTGTIGGDVTVATGARLAGSGLVAGNVLVQGGGKFAAGNSVGTMTVAAALDLDNGSIFEWELGSQTEGTRGTNYDAVDVAGALDVTGSVFKVIISGLDIDSAFWDNGHTWDVFNTAATGTFASFALYDAADLDNQVTYNTRGSFSFTSLDGDLKWTAIPEPTSALAGLLLGAGLLRRRRKEA